jgi:Uncharacterized protein conserved in bacteria (DUF2188)
MSNSDSVPPRLIELWLTLCHKALCRRVEGGLLAWLPEGSEHFPNSHVAVHLETEAFDRLTTAAKSIFGKDYAVHAISHNMASSEPFALRGILTELQEFLLESDERLPEDAQLLAFLLNDAGYRSSQVPVQRTNYHLVPEADHWILKLQGEQDGESFQRKEDGIKAGSERARSHPSAQLIIHLANGQFEECRTYGEPARE